MSNTGGSSYRVARTVTRICHRGDFRSLVSRTGARDHRLSHRLQQIEIRRLNNR